MSARVLMLSYDLVGPRMAGAGMRSWELAKVLSTHHPVVLAAPEGSQSPEREARVEFATYVRYDGAAMQRLVESSDIVVASGDSLLEFPFLLSCDKRFVMDVYDPHTLESLAWNEAGTLEERLESYRDRLRVVRLQCALGDFFVCASERQRMMWLGWLEATGRINPLTYERDHSLRRLIDIVATGIPAVPPQHTRRLVRGVVPGISSDDLLLVWGGGIWNWLDPLTLIRAVAQVAETHPRIRLYFPGPRHPYEAQVPDMAMHGAAVELAKALGLWEKHVFVGEWVPYTSRQNYLLEADAGCSLHFQSIESLFAFRTRVLDYIWADLPMIVTRGDATSELVKEYGLGVVVDYEDVGGVADAIRRLAETRKETFRPGFRQVQGTLSWEQNTAPLLAYCRDPERAPDRDMPAGANGGMAGIEQLVARQEEIAWLRSTISGYERGRFIRFMKWVHQTRQRLQEKLGRQAAQA